jgi:hypothetical protein
MDDFMLLVCLLTATDVRPRAAMLAKLVNASLVVACAIALPFGATHIDREAGAFVAGGLPLTRSIYRLLEVLRSADAARALRPAAQRGESTRSAWRNFLCSPQDRNPDRPSLHLQATGTYEQPRLARQSVERGTAFRHVAL